VDGFIVILLLVVSFIKATNRKIIKYSKRRPPSETEDYGNALIVYLIFKLCGQLSTKVCDYVRSGIESRCARLPSPMSTRRSHEMAGGAFSIRTLPFRRREDPGESQIS
jgi:hypothetical protein